MGGNVTNMLGSDPVLNDAILNSKPLFRRTVPLTPEFPKIVCLCGSTRFTEAWQFRMLEETLEGNIVLSIGSVTKSNDELNLTVKEKDALDELHLRKIDLADEILVLNVDGYIGESTRREISYAARWGKRIRFIEPVTELDLVDVGTPVVSQSPYVQTDRWDAGVFSGTLMARTSPEDVASWRASLGDPNNVGLPGGMTP